MELWTIDGSGHGQLDEQLNLVQRRTKCGLVWTAPLVKSFQQVTEYNIFLNFRGYVS
jgi:hypothetical protein